MAYTKKLWVNVPDTSNLPDTPEGQDALARFDAENMNRIEDGVSVSVSHVADKANPHNVTKAQLGLSNVTASATGASIGVGGSAISGGFAGGNGASANGGGAIGNGASALNGGGAIGNEASTDGGFAGGNKAKTQDESGKAINAIQLGTGTNKESKTLQVYDYKMMNKDGTIPDERMPQRLGEKSAPIYDDFVNIIQKGSGFYAVGNATDSPTGKESWLNLIQLTKGFTEGGGQETGVQIVADCLPANNSKGEFWVRTLFEGAPTGWKNLIHTDNISRHNIAKIQTGSYVGTGKAGSNNPNILSFSNGFKPQLIFVRSHSTGYTLPTVLMRGVPGAVYDSNNDSTWAVTWGDNSVEWYVSSAGDSSYPSKQCNEADVTYTYIAIG